MCASNKMHVSQTLYNSFTDSLNKYLLKSTNTKVTGTVLCSDKMIRPAKSLISVRYSDIQYQNQMSAFKVSFFILQQDFESSIDSWGTFEHTFVGAI